MICYMSSCRLNQDNKCTDENNFKICHQVIAAVQGNTDGCDLCKAIYNAKKYPESDHIAKNHKGDYDLFIYIGSNNEFGYMENIKYCPKCGRELR